MGWNGSVETEQLRAEAAFSFGVFVGRLERSLRTPDRAAEGGEEAGSQKPRREVGIVDNINIPTLNQFAPRFLEAIETQCASKPNTIDFHRRKLANLLSHDSMAGKRLDEIDERVIDAYKRDRSRVITRHKKLLSPTSINRELATLRRLLRLAHEWRVINRVPRIRLLRGERIREYIVSSEHEKLYFGMATGDLHDVAALLLETGLRATEALTLGVGQRPTTARSRGSLWPPHSPSKEQ